MSKSVAALLTIPEVAERLGVSRQTVYTLFHQKKLTPRKVGRLTRICPRELEFYLESTRAKKLTPAVRRKAEGDAQ